MSRPALFERARPTWPRQPDAEAVRCQREVKASRPVSSAVVRTRLETQALLARGSLPPKADRYCNSLLE